jgi:hypothetical protein
VQEINGFFVYIIESPSAEDLLDGRTEGRVLNEALALAGIPHVYSLVTNEEMLLKAFSDRLVEALRTLNRIPIIHFSLHGNNEGVALTDKKFLTWDYLRNFLLPLEQTFPGDLLLCMSSCFGFSGCRMAMTAQNELPFSALVGNSDEADWSDAAIAYITFYHLLFKGLSLEKAVEAMKIASDDHNFVCVYGDRVRQNWLDYRKQQAREEAIRRLRAAIQRNPQWRQQR